MAKQIPDPLPDSAPLEGADRRKSERIPLVLRVDYSTVDDFFSEFTANINEGGIFIETTEQHPADTAVALHFQLPGSEEPLQVTGRVVWNSPGEPGQKLGIGIVFEDLDQRARERIDRLVRSLRVESAPSPTDP
jgi:uncharacterized protein (TIGR02266 family)